MRLFVDTLVALMLVGILAGVVVRQRVSTDLSDQELITRDERRRLHQQVIFHSALADVALNPQGYPVTVDPAWFGGHPPRNRLLTAGRPWLEVAGSAQQPLMHPPDRATSDPQAASFWYNPYRGIVRARVPGAISDAAALELYNFVNECQLDSIFPDDR